MSGVFQSIFGGSRQSTSSTSTPVDATPPSLIALRQPFADVLTSLLGGAGTQRFNEQTKQNETVTSNPLAGIPTYTGPTTAPVSGPEQALLTALQGLGGGQGSGLLADTIAGKFTNPASNPFLNDYIKAAQRPTLEGLTETLTRALPGRFTAAGQFTQPQGSSAFDRAAAIATRGAANALSDIATNIGTNAYTSERNIQNQGIALGQQEVATTIQNLQAQALPRLIEQYGLDVGLQQFRDRLSALLSILGVASGSVRPNVANTVSSTGQSTSTPGVLPDISNLVSGIGSLYGRRA